MVEAAGVEPASENVTGEEPTCLADSCSVAGTFAAHAQKRQETRAASPKVSPPGSDRTRRPAHCATPCPQPVGKAAEDGYLIN